MSKVVMAFADSCRSRVVVASILCLSVALIASGVSATEGEGDEPIEVSYEQVLVVDTTEGYVVLAPRLSWRVPVDDPGVAPTGIEVRRTHQSSGEQVTFCVAGDVDGLLDSSVRYRGPGDETGLVAGNDYFTYEVRATRLEDGEAQTGDWSEPLSVRVSGRPADPRETGTDLAPAPSSCPQVEHTTVDGDDEPPLSNAPDPRDEESDEESDLIGVDPSDRDGTGATSSPDLPSCYGSFPEECSAGNAVWTPPGDGDEQEEEGSVPWEDIAGWKFSWTQCWNHDGNVMCTR